MHAITRSEAKKLMDQRDDLTVVEVLQKDQFDEFHLPGAKNVPLDEQFAENIQRTAPDKRKPVLVYCHDINCNASPKAAQKMEQLGYQDVYDYEAGKLDWKQAGLPVES